MSSSSRKLTIVFVDVTAVPWHSRWMSARYSVRRLLVALALSQALALQALLLSWSGALAVTGQFTSGLGDI